MIAERVGVTPAQVSALKAVANRGKRPTEVPADDEVGEALETTFGLERDLQKWLRQNIRDLEDGLSIVDNKEHKVASGFIDITGRDRAGAMVVIELKAGSADRDAIGQILACMGDLMLSEKSVRGVLIASDFTARAKAAARAACNLQLVRYGIKSNFAPVSSESAG